MLRKISCFFKQLFKKNKIIKIEAPKEFFNNVKGNNLFKEDLKRNTGNKIKLLEIQKNLQFGKIEEKDLSYTEIILIKELYCEQILELTKDIKKYVSN